MSIKKILIFNPFGIGDVLFTTPFIRNLKESIVGVKLSFICSRRAYPLLKNNPFLDNVSVYEKAEWKAILAKSKMDFAKQAWSFFCGIRKEKFDIVFDLSMNSQCGFFFALVGIKKRVGYNFKSRGRFLTHKIDIPAGYDNRHIADYYLSLLEFVGVSGKAHKFDLFPAPDAVMAARNDFKRRGFSKDLLIAVCPGSGDSWGQKTAYFKRWPENSFLSLCQRLVGELKAKVILFGSKSEEPLCSYVFDRMSKGAVNLCCGISLEEFYSYLSLCRVLVTNDGGPFHVAQALGVNSVCFFGPVNEKVYGIYPESDNHIVLRKDLACRPCYRSFKFKGCFIDKECLRSISVDEAFDAVKKLI